MLFIDSRFIRHLTLLKSMLFSTFHRAVTSVNVKISVLMLPVYSVFGFSVSGEAARFGRLVLLHYLPYVPVIIPAVSIRKGKYVVCQDLPTKKECRSHEFSWSGLVHTFSINFLHVVSEENWTRLRFLVIYTLFPRKNAYRQCYRAFLQIKKSL